MLVSQEANLVTLINVFETKPEQQQALIDQWMRFVEEVNAFSSTFSSIDISAYSYYYF